MRKQIEDEQIRGKHGQWNDGYFEYLDPVMYSLPRLWANKLPFRLTSLNWVSVTCNRETVG